MLRVGELKKTVDNWFNTPESTPFNFFREAMEHREK